jgi:hypothetical protein
LENAVAESDQETFEQYAARFGGSINIYDSTTVTASFMYEFSSFLTVLERIKDGQYRNSRGESLVIRTGVTTTLEPNAFAGFNNGIHYCGFTLGFLLHSAYLANQTMFRTRCFTDLTEATNHNAPSRLELCPSATLWTGPQESVLRALCLDEIDDGNNERRPIEAAFFLRYALMTLVLYHEFHHAQLGHCRLRRNLGHARPASEFVAYSTKPEECTLSRYFEYSCDIAAMIILSSTVADGEDFPTMAALVSLDTVTKVRLLLFACGLLSAAWYILEKRQRLRPLPMTHPRPECRMLNFFKCCSIGLERSKSGDVGVFSTAGDLALEDLWRAARWIPELKSAMDSFRNAGSAFSEDYAFVRDVAAPYREALDAEVYLAT